MKWKQWIVSLLVLVQLAWVQTFELSSSPRHAKGHPTLARREPGGSHLLDENGKRQQAGPLFIAGKDGSYGEDSRRFRRTFYTHDDWPRHRSPNRLLRNFVTITSSGIFRQMLREVGLVVAVSTSVIVWNCALVVGFDDLVGHHHAPLFGTSAGFPLLELPLDPFTLSSPALGLLLGTHHQNVKEQRYV
jgi:hypothetical protein